MSKPIVIAVLLACCSFAIAAQTNTNSVASAESDERLNITTLSNVTYERCKITRVEPDGISIFHSKGIAKIPFADLPEDIRAAYGYDPEIAREYGQRQAHARSEYQRRRNAAAAIRQADANIQAIVANGGKPSQGQYEIAPESAGGISLEYTDFDSLAAAEVIRLKNMMAPESALRNVASHIPKGGRITVHIKRITIGSANTKYFTCIVTDANKREIVRRTGSDDIAEVPGSDDMWWYLFIVDVAEPIDRYMNVYVVDAISNKRVQFKITRK